MPDYTEEDVANALFDIIDNGMSLNKASEKHNIPTSTLSARRNGCIAKSDPEGQLSNSRLSTIQEDRIIEWILRQERLGCAPSHAQVRSVVTKVLVRTGDDDPVGKKWVERFIMRRPEIQNKVGRMQEALRFNEFTPKAVN